MIKKIRKKMNFTFLFLILVFTKVTHQNETDSSKENELKFQYTDALNVAEAGTKNLYGDNELFCKIGVKSESQMENLLHPHDGNNEEAEKKSSDKICKFLPEGNWIFNKGQNLFYRLSSTSKNDEDDKEANNPNEYDEELKLESGDIKIEFNESPSSKPKNPDPPNRPNLSSKSGGMFESNHFTSKTSRFRTPANAFSSSKSSLSSEINGLTSETSGLLSDSNRLTSDISGFISEPETFNSKSDEDTKTDDYANTNPFFTSQSDTYSESNFQPAYNSICDLLQKRLDEMKPKVTRSEERKVFYFPDVDSFQSNNQPQEINFDESAPNLPLEDKPENIVFLPRSSSNYLQMKDDNESDKQSSHETHHSNMNIPTAGRLNRKSSDLDVSEEPPFYMTKEDFEKHTPRPDGYEFRMCNISEGSQPNLIKTETMYLKPEPGSAQSEENMRYQVSTPNEQQIDSVDINEVLANIAEATPSEVEYQPIESKRSRLKPMKPLKRKSKSVQFKPIYVKGPVSDSKSSESIESPPLYFETMDSIEDLPDSICQDDSGYSDVPYYEVVDLDEDDLKKLEHTTVDNPQFGFDLKAKRASGFLGLHLIKWLFRRPKILKIYPDTETETGLISNALKLKLNDLKLKPQSLKINKMKLTPTEPEVNAMSNVTVPYEILLRPSLNIMQCNPNPLKIIIRQIKLTSKEIKSPSEEIQSMINSIEQNKTEKKSNTLNRLYCGPNGNRTDLLMFRGKSNLLSILSSDIPSGFKNWENKDEEKTDSLVSNPEEGKTGESSKSESNEVKTPEQVSKPNSTENVETTTKVEPGQKMVTIENNVSSVSSNAPNVESSISNGLDCVKVVLVNADDKTLKCFKEDKVDVGEDKKVLNTVPKEASISTVNNLSTEICQKLTTVESPKNMIRVAGETILTPNTQTSDTKTSSVQTPIGYIRFPNGYAPVANDDVLGGYAPDFSKPNNFVRIPEFLRPPNNLQYNFIKIPNSLVSVNDFAPNEANPVFLCVNPTINKKSLLNGTKSPIDPKSLAQSQSVPISMNLISKETNTQPNVNLETAFTQDGFNFLQKDVSILTDRFSSINLPNVFMPGYPQNANMYPFVKCYLVPEDFKSMATVNGSECFQNFPNLKGSSNDSTSGPTYGIYKYAPGGYKIEALGYKSGLNSEPIFVDDPKPQPCLNCQSKPYGDCKYELYTYRQIGGNNPEFNLKAFMDSRGNKDKCEEICNYLISRKYGKGTKLLGCETSGACNHTHHGNLKSFVGICPDYRPLRNYGWRPKESNLKFIPEPCNQSNHQNLKSFMEGNQKITWYARRRNKYDNLKSFLGVWSSKKESGLSSKTTEGDPKITNDESIKLLGCGCPGACNHTQHGNLRSFLEGGDHKRESEISKRDKKITSFSFRDDKYSKKSFLSVWPKRKERDLSSKTTEGDSKVTDDKSINLLGCGCPGACNHTQHGNLRSFLEVEDHKGESKISKGDNKITSFSFRRNKYTKSFPSVWPRRKELDLSSKTIEGYPKVTDDKSTKLLGCGCPGACNHTQHGNLKSFLEVGDHKEESKINKGDKKISFSPRRSKYDNLLCFMGIWPSRKEPDLSSKNVEVDPTLTACECGCSNNTKHDSVQSFLNSWPKFDSKQVAKEWEGVKSNLKLTACGCGCTNETKHNLRSFLDSQSAKQSKSEELDSKKTCKKNKYNKLTCGCGCANESDYTYAYDYRHNRLKQKLNLMSEEFNNLRFKPQEFVSKPEGLKGTEGNYINFRSKFGIKSKSFNDFLSKKYTESESSDPKAELYDKFENRNLNSKSIGKLKKYTKTESSESKPKLYDKFENRIPHSKSDGKSKILTKSEPFKSKTEMYDKFENRNLNSILDGAPKKYTGSEPLEIESKLFNKSETLNFNPDQKLDKYSGPEAFILKSKLNHKFKNWNLNSYLGPLSQPLIPPASLETKSKPHDNLQITTIPQPYIPPEQFKNKPHNFINWNHSHCDGTPKPYIRIESSQSHDFNNRGLIPIPWSQNYIQPSQSKPEIYDKFENRKPNSNFDRTSKIYIPSKTEMYDRFENRNLNSNYDGKPKYTDSKSLDSSTKLYDKIENRNAHPNFCGSPQKYTGSVYCTELMCEDRELKPKNAMTDPNDGSERNNSSDSKSDADITYILKPDEKESKDKKGSDLLILRGNLRKSFRRALRSYVPGILDDEKDSITNTNIDSNLNKLLHTCKMGGLYNSRRPVTIRHNLINHFDGLDLDFNTPYRFDPVEGQMPSLSVDSGPISMDGRLSISRSVPVEGRTISIDGRTIPLDGRTISVDGGTISIDGQTISVDDETMSFEPKKMQSESRKMSIESRKKPVETSIPVERTMPFDSRKMPKSRKQMSGRTKSVENRTIKIDGRNIPLDGRTIQVGGTTEQVDGRPIPFGSGSIPVESRTETIEEITMPFDCRKIPVEGRTKPMDGRTKRVDRTQPVGDRRKSVESRTIKIDDRPIPLDDKTIQVDDTDVQVDGRSISIDDETKPFDARKKSVKIDQNRLEPNEDDQEENETYLDNKPGGKFNKDYPQIVLSRSSSKPNQYRAVLPAVYNYLKNIPIQGINRVDEIRKNLCKHSEFSNMYKSRDYTNLWQLNLPDNIIKTHEESPVENKIIMLFPVFDIKKFIHLKLMYRPLYDMLIDDFKDFEALYKTPEFLEYLHHCIHSSSNIAYRENERISFAELLRKICKSEACWLDMDWLNENEIKYPSWWVDLKRILNEKFDYEQVIAHFLLTEWDGLPYKFYLDITGKKF